MKAFRPFQKLNGQCSILFFQSRSSERRPFFSWPCVVGCDGRHLEMNRIRTRPKGGRIADTNLHFAGSGGGPADRNENARHSRLFAEA
ncbi:hypothetical protein ACH95_08475 [Bacillus glycinifermentans]|nr:hypothetical protein ACH95_08475 [Bacillus glycinifermentans]